MKKKQKYHNRNFIAGMTAILAITTVLFFCFFMIHNINIRMNESATSNLLNTTRVIINNMENDIEKDLEFLKVVGELYKNGVDPNSEEMERLRETMGFEWIGIAEQQKDNAEEAEIQQDKLDLSDSEQWESEISGYSKAYYGESGRLQTTLWVSIYDEKKFIGTVFGSVILSKYYSADLFTFYEGDGRTYLFDGCDGKWILKSLGADGASKREEDIYSLLLSSGNALKDIDIFRQAVESGKTGTAVLKFKDEESYLCFMPLPSSPNWYVATVIARDILLKESTQVQRIIWIIFTVFCTTLLFSGIALVRWQIRKTKIHEANYREALFTNISSNIDSAFLIYEKDTKKTVFVSDNVERLLEIERGWLEADAANLFDWCRMEKEDLRRAAFLNGTLKEPVACEVCVENELGISSRYIRLELFPADLGQEIAVLTDITKDKDVQRSLLDAMRCAETASRAKNDFLSAMSHDIRTPMNGIVGMTAIAEAHLDDKNRVKDCLKKIGDASSHLLNLINEILDMSRIESGKMDLSEEPFNLAELLSESLNMNFPGIRQKKHVIKAHIHSMKHERVIGDPVRIQRVVDNLISNAIKYTLEEGTILLELREKEPTIQGYGCYELIVQDNGIGMSPEFQKKLFQPFEREEDVRTSKIQGTGLGMSIAKNIITLMMGDIQVESEKGKGTTFRITVNLKLDEQDEELESQLAKYEILVVDDDVDTCEMVTNMLNDIGIWGEWADSGDLAVRKISARHSRGRDYMAVLLDWKMPGMDGVETARKIRAEVDQKVPIVILTAYDWSEIETEARNAGVDAFLSKPIFKTKLRQKLLTLLAAGQQEKPNLPEMTESKEIPAGKKILLAEDNELNMEIAVEILGLLNIQTAHAENGAVAVEMFAKSKPGTYDMILMDIQMPKMNGYEATKAIRNMDHPDSRTIPIVAMTADAFAQDIQAARAAGMNDHIAKPISVERLIQVISLLLGDPVDKSKEEE